MEDSNPAVNQMINNCLPTHGGITNRHYLDSAESKVVAGVALTVIFLLAGSMLLYVGAKTDSLGQPGMLASCDTAFALAFCSAVYTGAKGMRAKVTPPDEWKQISAPSAKTKVLVVTRLNKTMRYEILDRCEDDLVRGYVSFTRNIVCWWMGETKQQVEKYALVYRDLRNVIK